MAEPLNRDQVIELLDNLGRERDEDVLAAAREVHVRISEAGVSWRDLLLPATGADQSSDIDPGEDTGDTDPVPQTKTNADALTLIEALLAKPGISADLRQELADYKTDIAEGGFSDGDLNYLRALSKRIARP